MAILSVYFIQYEDCFLIVLNVVSTAEIPFKQLASYRTPGHNRKQYLFTF